MPMRSKTDDDRSPTTRDGEEEEVDPLEADEEQGEEEAIVACSLCYSSVDYSDLSYFCQEARDADGDFDAPIASLPKLLPRELWESNNALVYCDTCERPYHQQCHFVPIIALPRGDWHCLICTTTPQLLASGEEEWTKKTLSNKIYQMQSPATELELAWEYATRGAKIQAFKSEFRRLRKSLSLQLQNVRLAQMALKSLLQGRKALVNKFSSQELCQTVVKSSSAKLKVRQMLQSLDRYMMSEEESTLKDFLKENPSETQAWFPFGMFPKREPPRLVIADDDAPSEVPTEIVLAASSPASKKKKKAASSPCTTKAAAKADDDSGISLDNLKCSICFKGDATDDNDLLLCDGKGCFRAHHYQCLSPAMSPEKAEEEVDWFCPICTTLAKFVAEVQSEYTGDEWYNEEDDASVQSWDQVDDVFAGCELENEMALKWKNKKMDAECRTFLSKLFGDDDEEGDSDDVGMQTIQEEEDDEEDDDFCPNAKRTADGEHDDSDASTHGSGLADMESVGRKELANLSGGEDSSDEEDDDDEGTNKKTTTTRRSRRVRSSARSSRNNTDTEESTGAECGADLGRFDESNIVHGKRRRRQIDYRVLNDSMFGKLSAKDRSKIDDQDDFQYKAPKRRDSSSSSSEDESSSDNDSDDDEEKQEGTTSKEASESDAELGKAPPAKRDKKTAVTKKPARVKRRRSDP